MKGLAKEELERDVLKLNGIMTKEIFDSVMKRLKKKKYLSCNSGEDNQNDADVHNYLGALENNADDTLYSNNNFPIARKYYKYKNIRFIWEVMFGQGSHCSLLIDDTLFEENKQVMIKEIDTELKFYKVI